MKQTSQRSLLFRQNVGRTEEEWAHFLDGYRQALSLRLDFGRAEEAGMKGWRERTAGIFTKHSAIAAKMKSAPGPVPSDSWILVESPMEEYPVPRRPKREIRRDPSNAI